MLFFVCRFYGRSFSQLNTFKIKTICWKQSTKKWKYIHYKSIPLLFLFFRPTWLHGLLTPRCITLLPSTASPIHYPARVTGLAEGTFRRELRGDSYLARPVWVKKLDHTGSVSSPQTSSKKPGFTSVSEVPRHLPVQKEETLARDQNESWEENSATWSPQWGWNQTKQWRGRNHVLGFTDNL